MVFLLNQAIHMCRAFKPCHFGHAERKKNSFFVETGFALVTSPFWNSFISGIFASVERHKSVVVQITIWQESQKEKKNNVEVLVKFVFV